MPQYEYKGFRITYGSMLVPSCCGATMFYDFQLRETPDKPQLIKDTKLLTDEFLKGFARHIKNQDSRSLFSIYAVMPSKVRSLGDAYMGTWAKKAINAHSIALALNLKRGALVVNRNSGNTLAVYSGSRNSRKHSTTTAVSQ